MRCSELWRLWIFAFFKLRNYRLQSPWNSKNRIFKSSIKLISRKIWLTKISRNFHIVNVIFLKKMYFVLLLLSSLKFSWFRFLLQNIYSLVSTCSAWKSQTLCLIFTHASSSWNLGKMDGNCTKGALKRCNRLVLPYNTIWVLTTQSQNTKIMNFHWAFFLSVRLQPLTLNWPSNSFHFTPLI